MSKETFFNTLTAEQQSFVEYLIDEAYSNGYSAGVINTYENEL